MTHSRPTIPSLVPQYAEVGITKANAVAYVVDSHMRSNGGRGKGSKAKRRAEHIALSRFPVGTLDADELAERFQEARIINHSKKPNHHDE